MVNATEQKYELMYWLYACAECLTHCVALHSPENIRPLRIMCSNQEGVLVPMMTLTKWLRANFIGPKQKLPLRRELIIRDFVVAFFVAARPVVSLGEVDTLRTPLKLRLAEVSKFFCQTMEEIICSLKGQVMIPVSTVEHLMTRALMDFDEYLYLYARFIHEDAVATWALATEALGNLREHLGQINSGPEEQVQCMAEIQRVLGVIAAYERMYPEVDFQQEANSMGPVTDDNNLIPY